MLRKKKEVYFYGLNNQELTFATGYEGYLNGMKKRGILLLEQLKVYSE